MYMYKCLTLLLFSTVGSDNSCFSGLSQSVAIRLRKYILCDYDKNSRPIRDHNQPVNLSIQTRVIYYDYNTFDNSFTADSWMGLQWIDEHLAWNPADYESIKSVHLSSNNIWVPDFSIYNKKNGNGEQSVIRNSHCTVKIDGEVRCVVSTSYTTVCISDYTNFPYDEHNCTVRFGSWTHTGEELNLEIDVITEDLVPNGEWKLINTSAYKHPGVYECCPNNTYPSVDLSFKIQRLSGSHTASVVFSAIVLIIITLTSLWLAPDNPHRLNLCYINIISEFVYLEYLYWMIPMNNDYRIPLILLFARDSVVLSVFTLIFTLGLANMMKNEQPVPELISNVVSVLVAFRLGQFVFLSNCLFKGYEEYEHYITAVHKKDATWSKTQWLIFSKILNRLCIGIFVLIYLCMFIAFNP
ncbi:neuronal acetylcholine receptor subunit alpha-2-like [Zophobas morio]|uniref:neuronal acetylcholine receptor subunit alpha-2-like n=1 Tax=Zophobas morio TaxID=2755281 RepID=UPI003082A85A